MWENQELEDLADDQSLRGIMFDFDLFLNQGIEDNNRQKLVKANVLVRRRELDELAILSGWSAESNHTCHPGLCG